MLSQAIHCATRNSQIQIKFKSDRQQKEQNQDMRLISNQTNKGNEEESDLVHCHVQYDKELIQPVIIGQQPPQSDWEIQFSSTSHQTKTTRHKHDL